MPVTEALASLLRECAHEGPIWYHPNPGNAGDALIAHATYGVFEQLGVEWRSAEAADFVAEGRNVVYGGGGNLVPGYNVARQFLERHHGTARRMILLPHTVDANEDLLRSLGPNVHLFLRERRSFEHCGTHAPEAHVCLEHDLALSLTPDQMRRPQPLEFAQACWNALRRTKPPDLRMVGMVLQRILRDGWPNGQVLDAFRTDRESSGGPLPVGNRDLSETFLLGSMEPRWASLSARLLLGWVAGASVVRTDRLHVAIAASLQDVPVEFHPNSYFKCLAIHEHSLKDRFRTIHWCG